MFALETQSFIRVFYSILMLTLFIRSWPLTRTYFTSAKWRGFIDPTPFNDAVFRPGVYYGIMAVWTGAQFCLFTGRFCVAAAAVNLLFCYNFFVRMRWTSLLRGMGAPGYISTWLGAYVFLSEYATWCGDPEGKLRSLVYFVFQYDFAIMMIDAGINKIMHGYPKHNGMNYGMANPAWGYWPGLFKNWPLRHPVFRVLNHSAYFFEILGGILMLIPPVKWIGAFIIWGSFGFVKLVIRLGVLCDQLMLITFLYTSPGGWVHRAIMHFGWFEEAPVLGAFEAPVILNRVLAAALSLYILLLPLAKLGMYFNFYGKKRLPEILQKALHLFTNTFGIILWRVFTVELIDYFMEVYFEDPATGRREKYTRFGHWGPDQRHRFLWVGESITSVIVFNSVRYFGASDFARGRIIRYARTFPCPEGNHVIFRQVNLIASEKGFEEVPVKEFRVDPVRGEMTEKVLDETAVKQNLRADSVVRQSAGPGSYAPARVS